MIPFKYYQLAAYLEGLNLGASLVDHRSSQTSIYRAEKRRARETLEDEFSQKNEIYRAAIILLS
jgi:hypothetical protein